jgi:hypothetical protein
MSCLQNGHINSLHLLLTQAIMHLFHQIITGYNIGINLPGASFLFLFVCVVVSMFEATTTK